jgi:glycosyltransferase involved in cell wall biosynthesis
MVLQHQAHKLAEVEAAFAHRVSLNLMVSDVDAERLRDINPLARTRLVENGTDVEYFRPQDERLEANTIVFAASLRWYPNQSALAFFDREIWPRIKQRSPGVHFIVAGQQPPEFLVRWAKSDASIEFVPDPADIRPYIARGAVYVCPIIDGGGSRLKLLDAMAMGKAIVSTTIGAEGLRYRAGLHMLIADDPQEFADKVVGLMQDGCECRRLAATARQLVKDEYSWQAIGSDLARAYKEAVAGGGEQRTVAAGGASTRRV